MRSRLNTASIIIAGLLASGAAVGQDLFVYPQKGQSSAQMDQDKYQCYEWARNQTGIDPVRGSPAPAQTQSTVGSGIVGGALTGLVIGNVAGGSGSKGAATGALLGGLSSGARDNRRRSASQQSASRSQQSYNRAYAACLEGRGYTVK